MPWKEGGLPCASEATYSKLNELSATPTIYCQLCRMFIAVEIGNTTAKLGRFSADRLEEVRFLPAKDFDAITFILGQWQARSEEETLFYGVASGDTAGLNDLPIRWLNEGFKWPFELAYETPNTLGVDRLLVTAAAYLTYGDGLLVVSAGTCITYNVVSGGQFLGGAISPGWDMRYAAMQEFTHALPRAKKTTHAKLLGTNTLGSLHAGVDCALPLEVEAMIQAYVDAFSIEHVLICGGDSPALEEHIKKYIFAPSNYELLALQLLYANETNKSH